MIFRLVLRYFQDERSSQREVMSQILFHVVTLILKFKMSNPTMIKVEVM